MTLDAARYALALLSLATIPWAIAFWYLVHPLVGLWRRVGPTRTYALLGALLAAWIAATWQWREPLLAVVYGTGPAWWGAAGICYALALSIETSCRRHLSWRVLVGLPELRPQPGCTRLLQEGIYARLRHPRYLAVSFALLALALFCNYLATWLLLGLWLLALPGLVVLEERELVERFGEPYVQYARRVPRFLPRFGAPPASASPRSSCNP